MCFPLGGTQALIRCVGCMWRVIATITTSPGVYGGMVPVPQVRAHAPVLRPTPPLESGFGTDCKEGGRSTAAPWAPPVP